MTGWMDGARWLTAKAKKGQDKMCSQHMNSPTVTALHWQPLLSGGELLLPIFGKKKLRAILNGGTTPHKEQKHIPGHYALSSFLAHALSCIHNRLPTRGGGDILSQYSRAGIEQLTVLRNGSTGILGSPAMMETNKMADH